MSKQDLDRLYQRGLIITDDIAINPILDFDLYRNAIVNKIKNSLNFSKVNVVTIFNYFKQLNTLILMLLSIISASVVLVSQSVEAGEKNNVEETAYFSIEPLDNWIYETYASSYSADIMGYGVSNAIHLYPNEFDDYSTTSIEIKQVAEYSVKNAPLEKFFKSYSNLPNIMNITSQAKSIIDGEEAIKIYGTGIGDFSGTKYVAYFTMYDNESYYLGYQSDQENYDKYLPEFEQMIQTFNFIK